MATTLEKSICWKSQNVFQKCTTLNEQLKTFSIERDSLKEVYTGEAEKHYNKNDFVFCNQPGLSLPLKQYISKQAIHSYMLDKQITKLQHPDIKVIAYHESGRWGWPKWHRRQPWPTDQEATQTNLIFIDRHSAASQNLSTQNTHEDAGIAFVSTYVVTVSMALCSRNFQNVKSRLDFVGI